MSLIDEILQGLPVNPLLREKVAKLDAEKAAAETENAILKDDLREAKAEIAKLNQQVEKLTHKAPVDEMELEFLKSISAHDRLTDQQIASMLQLNLQRVRYHLQRLRELGYLGRSKVLVNGASPHRLTQDGRGFLIANGLL